MRFLLLVLVASCTARSPSLSTMANDSQTSVLHPAELVGFLATADSVRCREFYSEKLGFRVESEDPMALVLSADGRMIRVQKAREHTPRPYTVLGWNVPDIEAAVTRLVGAGVACERFGFPGQDERGIMTFSDGTRVAWFKDPDANILSVAQMPR